VVSPIGPPLVLPVQYHRKVPGRPDFHLFGIIHGNNSGVAAGGGNVQQDVDQRLYDHLSVSLGYRLSFQLG
jgi:hypothetical protein